MRNDAVRRPGWVRPVAVPTSLDELTGPVTGTVGLPRRLFWSGPDPDAVRALVNRNALVDRCADLYLSPWVRESWQPLVDDARDAA